MTHEKKVELLAQLLMSQPWTLVACGLGNISGGELALRLLDAPVPTPAGTCNYCGHPRTAHHIDCVMVEGKGRR